MAAPLVYVIVINWNGREHLDACFQSLLASTYENAVFLLVDNASADGSVTYVREHFGADSRVDIMALADNLGWSGGNNAGLKRALAAGADYVLLLNNDTAIDAEALSILVARMDEAPALGALAPRMLLFEQPDILNSAGLRLSIIGAAWDIGVGRIDGPRWHDNEALAGVCGGACFLRAAALHKTGLLPESFEIYLDDLDLCLRLWHAGYTIERCAGAVVRHKFSATMGAGRRARHKYYLNTRNRFRILLRHFPGSRALPVGARVAVGELRAMGRGILSGEWWRVPAHLRAWFAALAYLPEARRFRHGHAAEGLPPFWPLVVRSPLFCPALLLPSDGWYPAIPRAMGPVRPMARRAWLDIPAGLLQVSLANCYPVFGTVRITLHLDGSLLGALEATETAEAQYDTAGGTLEVVAESLFLLEDTGAPADTGAWLRLQCDGRPLV